MLDTVNLTGLRGKRVQVTLRNGEGAIGVLRGVTDSALWLGEDAVPRSDVTSVTEAPLYCTDCGDTALVLYEGLCASCVRKKAAKAPAYQERCQKVDCDRPGVRQPGTDIFLCAQHHAEAGHALRLHHGGAQVLAECFTEDVSSPKHEWRPTRGARFRCIRCQNAEKWDPQLLKEMQKGSVK